MNRRWIFPVSLIVAVLVLSLSVVSALAFPPLGSVWSTGLEKGIGEWSNLGGCNGTAFNAYQPTGLASATVVTNRHREGTHSLKMTIDTRDEKAAVRMTRYNEACQLGATYVYGSSYLLPSKVTPLNDMWNVMQWKAKEDGDTTGSHPVWTINLLGDPLRVVLKWKGGSDSNHPVGFPGPFASSANTDKKWTQTLKTVPINSWFELRAELKMTSDYTGHLYVWQDATRLFTFENIRSTYDTSSRQSWGVDHYSNGLNVNPYSMYVDNAYVRTP